MTFYDQERISIYHGDCVDVLSTLPKADLILTSPPYGTLRDYGGHGFDWRRVVSAIVPALKPGGVIVWVVADQTIDGSESGESFRQALYFMDYGLRLHDTMIYERTGMTNPTPNRYHNMYSFMFIFSEGAPRTFNAIIDHPATSPGRTRSHAGFRTRSGLLPSRPGHYTQAAMTKRSNIWRIYAGSNHSAPDFLAAHQHPAIFPLALARDHISTWTNPGDLVIDPMCGSGTTLRAAKDLDRRAIGIDIHEPYCALAGQRMDEAKLLE